MKPAINNLNNALTFHLEGMYDAEKQLQKSIPNCIKLASSRALKAELKNYLQSAADKRTKLKRIFSYLLSGPYGRKNKAVGEMLKDSEYFARQASGSELKDAVLIGCLQGISHYKISAYGTASAFSMQLGLDQVTDMLDEMLVWEKNTSKALSRIALKRVNKRAAMIL